MTLPFYPSVVPQCRPVLVQWLTRCPLTLGWLRLFQLLHQCIQFQASWVHPRACSLPIQATASSTPHLAWSRVCSPWAHLLTSALPVTVINTRWRMTGVPASLHSGWRPKSTFSPWIKPGSTCNSGESIHMDFHLWMFTHWFSNIEFERIQGPKWFKNLCETSDHSLHFIRVSIYKWEVSKLLLFQN